MTDGGGGIDENGWYGTIVQSSPAVVASPQPPQAEVPAAQQQGNVINLVLLPETFWKPRKRKGVEVVEREAELPISIFMGSPKMPIKALGDVAFSLAQRDLCAPPIGKDDVAQPAVV
jgi:hypothetical protein